MPNVRKTTDDVIAILCGDIHLSHNPPLARAGEPDWYKAMRRPLWELECVATSYNAPILMAGDIFDKPDNPSELVNFALRHLPNDVYAIPGQHDLPFHRYEDIEMSSYWTLVMAGKITNLPRYDWRYAGSPIIHAYAFPWDTPIKPPHDFEDNPLKDLLVAVCHRYVWTPGAEYPGAPKEAHISNLFNDLKGYDVAVFGDNHNHFAASFGDLHIWNCGTFMRRKADEADYGPRLGLLCRDGTITTHYLDVSKDVINTAVSPSVEALVEDGTVNLSTFLNELKELGNSKEDFHEATRRYMRHNNLSLPARRILTAAIGQ